MTAREKLAAALILPGMLLLCAEQLPAAMAGIALLGLGAMALNIKKKAARLTRRRHAKNISYTSYQRKADLSNDGSGNHQVL